VGVTRHSRHVKENPIILQQESMRRKGGGRREGPMEVNDTHNYITQPSFGW